MALLTFLLTDGFTLIVIYRNMFDYARQYNIQPMVQFLQNFSYIEVDMTGETMAEGSRPFEGSSEAAEGESSSSSSGAGAGAESKQNLQLIVKDPSLAADSLSNPVNQDYRLINALKETTDEEKIFQILDEWSNNLHRQPLFGESSLYFEKICQLLNSFCERNRITGHNVLLRMLQVNSGNKQFVQGAYLVYSKLLESGDNAVINSTLEVLNEAIAYLQEFAPDMLKMVFHLGVTSQTNTFTCMRKCFAVLNLQKAC